jgi:RNA recognition motif-containing protein
MNFLKSENYTPLRAKLLYNQEGLSRGTGFVQMSSSQEASQVIDKLNNISFEGRNLQFNMANN